MITYKVWTLRTLIDTLTSLHSEAMVFGVDLSVTSYRGYYDRVSFAPAHTKVNAHLWATYLKDMINRDMIGYKGGLYRIDGDKPLHIAPWGETGPIIIGMYRDENGTYQFITLEEWP
jgi:hypothetical protein